MNIQSRIAKLDRKIEQVAPKELPEVILVNEINGKYYVQVNGVQTEWIEDQSAKSRILVIVKKPTQTYGL